MKEQYGQYWWKFSNYEIKDGYIQPTSKAKIEKYNPWKNDKAGDFQQSYQSLIYLISKIETRPNFSSDNPYILTPKSERMIINWAKEFGLLGILLQEVLMVTLTPRERGSEDEQYKYVRNPMGWETIYQSEKAEWYDERADEFVRYPPEFPPPDSLQKETYQFSIPKVLRRELGKYEVKEEPLSRTFGRFFPGVPSEQKETYLYPRPLQEHDFWRQYAEPVKDFIQWAAYFTEALKPKTDSHLFDPQYESFIKSVGFDPNDAVPIQEVSTSLSKFDQFQSSPLNWFLSTVHFSIFKSNGKTHRCWLAPSLIAMFATMAALDSIKGNRTVKCANPTCETYFITTSPSAQYCSAKCRRTVQKRRQRERQRS